MKKKTDKLVWGIVMFSLLVGIGYTIFSTTFWKWVPTGEVAVVYNANRGIDRDRVLEPGRHVRGFLDELITAPTNIVAANYTSDPDFAEDRVSDSVEVTTKQGVINFDVLVMYRVEKEDIWKVFDNFARQDINTIQATRIRREIKNAANQVSGRFNLEDLIGSQRADANMQFTRELREALKPLGFSVEQAYFVTAYPNDRIRDQFLNIETADIYRQIAALKAQAAERQKNITIITAKAQKESADLVALTTTEKSIELQKLEIELEEAKKWDGSRVRVDTTGLNSVLIGDQAMAGAKR